MKCFKNLFLFTSLVLFVSCVNDVDFDQADNLQLSPVIESNVFYGTIPASNFQSSSGSPITVVQDYYDVELFDDEFVVDNLTKAEIFFEFTNSIATSMVASLVFQDAADVVLHSVTVNILPVSLASPVVTNHTEVFENTTLDALKQTKKITVVLTVPGGTVVAQDGANLVIKSKGTFFMNVTTN